MSAELIFDLVGEKYEINQGATYHIVFPYVTSGDDQTPVDLTDYTARMQIRPARGSGDALYSATTDDDLSISGSTGRVSLTIPAETTEGFTWRSGYYDIEIVSPAGNVIRLCEGRVGVSPETTKN